ncbi:hypothetical protein FQR65_LT15780 [Abscondita terminalis]|nr:hypothetical protein FQR65_LT15780 [Abscondita terminalis]
MNAIRETNFNFENQTAFYRGKVRDVYTIADRYLAMVATDRISAFDVVLPRAIPYKGQVLNQIAAKFLKATEDILPNWVVEVPDPSVTMDYLSRDMHGVEYSAGRREVCGEKLVERLKENDKLPEPIITPTTKAAVGHDEDISRADILKKGFGLMKESVACNNSRAGSTLNIPKQYIGGIKRGLDYTAPDGKVYKAAELTIRPPALAKLCLLFGYGTQAITNPEFLEELSTLNEGKIKDADHIVIAIDVLDEVMQVFGMVRKLAIQTDEYIDKCLALGFYRFLCTDISKDGKLGGAGVELYKKLLDHSPIIKLIGSGGISSMDDIRKLQELGRMESCVVQEKAFIEIVFDRRDQRWNLKSLIKAF